MKRMKPMSLNKVEIGKVYLFGDSDGVPRAIVWPTGKNKEARFFWGRMLTTEKWGPHDIFFSYGSFRGPSQYQHFLRELTKEELRSVEKIVTAKLRSFFSGEDPVDDDLGMRREAEIFSRFLLEFLSPNELFSRCRR